MEKIEIKLEGLNWVDADGNCWARSSTAGASNGSRDETEGRLLPTKNRVRYDPWTQEYDMSGNKYLFIFNHTSWSARYFKYDLPSPRDSSACDVKSLKDTFGNVDFTVEEPFDNYTHDEIMDKIKAICKMDHSNTSCVAFAVLTHGSKGGKVLAADKEYFITDIINFVLNEDTLAGKPKLFFIQACRGGNVDKGKRVSTDGRAVITIPTHADCLVLMSSFEGFVSYKGNNGSWLIQELCEVVDEYHVDKDILHMITLINKRIEAKISHSKDSAHDEKKQIPETRFTLTKLFKF